MNLDKFSIPRKLFGIINSVNRDDEQDLLICAVMRYIYDHDDGCAQSLRAPQAIIAFERIRELIDKPLASARKAKARREDRKAHPEKYPPRQAKTTRKAGAVELPSGHVIESDTPSFDYYCIKDNLILYFRMIGCGEVDDKKATFTSTFDESKAISAAIQPPLSLRQ